jgi:4'-phosphopantetheinyl transferase
MWQSVPTPQIRTEDVHVWQARLDLEETTLQKLRTVISEDEQKRAGRFHFERDRRRFVVARGILRSVLAQYLKLRPEDVQFRYEVAGKPYLACSGNEPQLHFNVSHSHELALIGLCLDHRVGIDIEFKNPDRATLDLARHFFAPEEVAALARLPVEAQCDAFFAVWTMKEAYIKGRGEGVSLGLDTFAVSTGDEKPPGLLRSDHGDDEPKRWRFWSIDAGPSYAAAVTVEGAGERRLSFWNATPKESRVSGESCP